MSTTAVAGKLGISRPAVSVVARRGETVVRENGYRISVSELT